MSEFLQKSSNMFKISLSDSKPPEDGPEIDQETLDEESQILPNENNQSWMKSAIELIKKN